MELDALDKVSAKAFDGYIVRKDLVRQFKGQYPVPTYVCEFLLGRYCASIDPTEIEEGLKIVSRQLSDRAVRAGEEELFKSRSREQGSVKIIDHNHEQPDKAQPNGDLEAAKAAARQAVEEPEPAPLPEAGDRPRSPAEMVGAVLSNLTLCIEADTLDEAVQYAKQAQRWALILKREVK